MPKPNTFLSSNLAYDLLSFAKPTPNALGVFDLCQSKRK